MSDRIIIGYDVVGEPMTGQLCYFKGYTAGGHTISYKSDGTEMIWRFNTTVVLDSLTDLDKKILGISNLG